MTLWMLDKTADWAERFGNFIAGPWYRLSEWAARRWWAANAAPFDDDTSTGPAPLAPSELS